jgi:acyl carrier protein
MVMSADENLSDTTALTDLGVDSLIAVELRTWFGQELDMDVAVLKILGGVSARDLVEMAVEKLAATKFEDKEVESRDVEGKDVEVKDTEEKDV